MPLVSVVMPTHNRLPLLQLAVASVRAQTFSDWELIVVDDGSTDGSTRWLEGLGDPRVRVITLPRGGTVGWLRNVGTDAASGDLLTFLDSDDLWEASKLQVQLACLRAAEAEWSYTRYDHIDAAGAAVPARAGEWRELSGWIAADMIEDRTAVSVVTVMMTRDLFERLGGFNEDMLTREDFDFLLRAALRAPTLAVAECLAHARQHPARTTAAMSPAELHETSASMYARLLPLLDGPTAAAARRRQRDHLARAAAAHLRAGRLLRAGRCYGLRRNAAATSA